MRDWLKRLIPGKKQQENATLGVSMTPEGAAWCVLENLAGTLSMTAFGSVEGTFKTPADAFDALWNQVALPQLPCYLTLSHHFYNMLLVDSPGVPDQELREAVKWRLKDLIAQPIEKMVVDVFRLPADAYRGRMNMLYAAVIEKSVVVQLVEVCERRGMPLRNIGIAELAMAAIMRQLPAVDNLSLAVLYLAGDSGSINLIENGYLYLTRTLEMHAAGGSYSGNLDFQQDPTDNLALDIQRSLDYYESQLGKSGVNRLYVVSGSPEQQQWCDGLSQRLPLRAQSVVLSDLVALSAEPDVQQQGLLAPALGAALGGRRANA